MADTPGDAPALLWHSYLTDRDSRARFTVKQHNFALDQRCILKRMDGIIATEANGSSSQTLCLLDWHTSFPNSIL